MTSDSTGIFLSFKCRWEFLAWEPVMCLYLSKLIVIVCFISHHFGFDWNCICGPNGVENHWRGMFSCGFLYQTWLYVINIPPWLRIQLELFLWHICRSKYGAKNYHAPFFIISGCNWLNYSPWLWIRMDFLLWLRWCWKCLAWEFLMCVVIQMLIVIV